MQGAGPAPSKSREVEMPKSGRQKSVLFSNMEGAHQSTVGKAGNQGRDGCRSGHQDEHIDTDIVYRHSTNEKG